jgi:hypothetical protein
MAEGRSAGSRLAVAGREVRAGRVRRLGSGGRPSLGVGVVPAQEQKCALLCSSRSRCWRQRPVRDRWAAAPDWCEFCCTRNAQGRRHDGARVEAVSEPPSGRRVGTPCAVHGRGRGAPSSPRWRRRGRGVHAVDTSGRGRWGPVEGRCGNPVIAPSPSRQAFARLIVESDPSPLPTATRPSVTPPGRCHGRSGSRRVRAALSGDGRGTDSIVPRSIPVNVRDQRSCSQGGRCEPAAP